MMASYQLSERVNVQVILWPMVTALYWLAVGAAAALGWLWTVLCVVGTLVLLMALTGVEVGVAVGKWLITHRAAILYAGRVLVITAGWLALLVGAVVLSVLYWHIVVAAGLGALAMWATYPRPHSL